MTTTPTVLADSLAKRARAVEITSAEQSQPTADRILVLPAPEETKRGGIHIPDNGREKPQRGVVVRTGPGRQCPGGCGALVPMEVKEGDTVLYGKYAGTDRTIDNTQFIIMREEEVLGIVRPKQEPQLPADAAVN